jgi:transposase-like protein
MANGERPLLTGTVEADETWVGGKRRHVGSGYIDNKVQVLGAVERGGDIRLSVHMKGKRADSTNLQAFIKSVVADDAPAIYTDENPGYAGIADEDTIHATVNHRDEEWVRGDVHTNTCESAWSLFKRSIVGSYHQLSVKHLDAYLGEFEWRFNNRENPYLFRDTLCGLLKAETLPYKALTA